MRRRRSSSAISVWPGFVDALSALLMLVIFMLLIYTLTQLYLSQSLTNRDAELTRLNARLVEISELLGLESQQVRVLADQLQVTQEALVVSRDREAILQVEAGRLADTVDADREQIKVLLGTQASLQQDILALRTLRAELEQNIAQLQQSLLLREVDLADRTAERDEQIVALGALRDRTLALAAELADERERTLLAQRDIDRQAVRIEDLLAIVSEGELALAESSVLTTAQQAQVAQLDRRIEQLQNQLRVIGAALQLQESVSMTQEIELAALGERLNTLLAAQVSELEQYQSEFFRNLRTILGDRDDIQVIGDRFLLPSELLFASGSADIEAMGLAELNKVAALVIELTGSISDDVEWILRVDGHTDNVPIQTAQFPSNWELSVARALAVVRYLQTQGVPAERMAATGFGEHQPIDQERSAAALRTNRRIEFKLTNR